MSPLLVVHLPIHRKKCVRRTYVSAVTAEVVNMVNSQYSRLGG